MAVLGGCQCGLRHPPTSLTLTAASSTDLDDPEQRERHGGRDDTHGTEADVDAVSAMF